MPHIAKLSPDHRIDRTLTDDLRAELAVQGSAKGQSFAKNAELAALVVEMNAFKDAIRRQRHQNHND